MTEYSVCTMNWLKTEDLLIMSYFFLFGDPIGLYSPQKGFDFTVERGSRETGTDRDRQSKTDREPFKEMLKWRFLITQSFLPYSLPCYVYLFDSLLVPLTKCMLIPSIV